MRLIRDCRRSIVVAILATCAAGCSPQAQQYIRFPNLASPGPAAVQRAEAIYHDPYPLNDIGPEIVGGRPLAYQQSVNEVERARMVPAQPVLIQPAPIPGMTVVAPPVMSSPYAVAPPQPAAPLMPAPPTVMTTAQPVFGPPIVTAPYAVPAVPAGFPQPAPPPPVVTSPYPAAGVPVTVPLQPRAPY